MSAVRIVLAGDSTVTDSEGLLATQSVLIYPEKVNLTFASNPSGLTLVVGGEKNAYWFASDFVHLKTVSVDEWR